MGIDSRSPGSNHTSDLTTGTLLAIVPGFCHCKASVKIGWPGVSIL